MKKILYLLTVVFIFLISCSKQNEKQDMKENKIENKVETKIELTSSAFVNDSTIPNKYTCKGEDISPPLKWNQLNAGVKSYAIIMDDPDAPGGDFVHWLIYNIPSTVTELPENFSSAKSSNSVYPQGMNDFHKAYYKGPCPPSGTHRYYFKLYALKKMLDIKEGVSKKELLDAMNGHIAAQTELIGKYSKIDNKNITN